MMKESVITLALIANVIVAPLDASPPREGRIKGGTTVAEEEIPWMVSIQDPQSRHDCGASIISPDWILTSGWCIYNNNVAGYKVRAGSLFSQSGGTLHTIVEKVMLTENNDPFRDIQSISVMKVSPPFTYGIMTGPVALPDGDTFSAPGTLMTVAGWGQDSNGGTESQWLLKIEDTMISSWQCDMMYSQVGGIRGLTPDQMCAVSDVGKAMCSGDDGSPLFRDGVLYGIAIARTNQCYDQDYPGRYTNVSSYRSWINEVTGI